MDKINEEWQKIIYEAADSCFSMYKITDRIDYNPSMYYYNILKIRCEDKLNGENSDFYLKKLHEVEIQIRKLKDEYKK